jgi:hypothetical protein
MFTYHACEKCDAPVRRSRRRNLWEFLLGPIMLPYRCTVCDRREMKLRWLDMETTGPKPEDLDDLIIAEPTERELEEQRKADARAAERAAKKAAKEQEKKAAKKEARKEVAKEAKTEVKTEAKPEAKKAKAAAAAVGATRLSSTSDEEEEQTSPN